MQKTAYEMRISDWSSDVCSSDLSGKKLGTASSISATRKATIDVIFQRGKSSILVVRRLGATRRDRRQRGFDDLDLDAGGDLDLDDQILDLGHLADDPARGGQLVAFQFGRAAWRDRWGQYV